LATAPKNLIDYRKCTGSCSIDKDIVPQGPA